MIRRLHFNDLWENPKCRCAEYVPPSTVFLHELQGRDQKPVQMVTEKRGEREKRSEESGRTTIGIAFTGKYIHANPVFVRLIIILT